MLICRIERCDTAVYYLLQSTEDHYHSIGRIHIFLLQHWDLFYSRASVFLQQRLLSSCFARSDGHRRVTCSAGCCVPFDWILQLQLSVDLSGSSAVYRQNLQTLLSVSSTLHFPVAPRVLLRASHRHRIASQRGLSFLLNRTECFLDDQIRKSQRRVLHC